MKFVDHPLFVEYSKYQGMARAYEYKSGLRVDDKHYVHRLNVANRLPAIDASKYLRVRKREQNLADKIVSDLMGNDNA